MTRADNAALRSQIESMLDSYEHDTSALLDAQQRAAQPVTVWSDDNLVRVTATIAGVVDVHIEAEAFKNSTPHRLGASITTTVQEAARVAAAGLEQAMAPWTALAESMPDLPDLVPGAPSTKDLLARLSPPPPDRVTPPPLDDGDEDEDDYFRNQGYLR
ncbi:YbaB/EbfC family nucleoid-associated protein [Nocardia shimofusensis]|uniref:YbaB/EbfC family nucleoid-associated protein n=1 Tax=Nocardia shimofusensis TaxID=228596 RepID=UPI000A013443|nr:YbaB/EbfC family nucleoid-associated protein [Nocardia shimofusensis]